MKTAVFFPFERRDRNGHTPLYNKSHVCIPPFLFGALESGTFGVGLSAQRDSLLFPSQKFRYCNVSSSRLVVSWMPGLGTWTARLRHCKSNPFSGAIILGLPLCKLLGMSLEPMCPFGDASVLPGFSKHVVRSDSFSTAMNGVGFVYKQGATQRSSVPLVCACCLSRLSFSFLPGSTHHRCLARFTCVFTEFYSMS